MRTNDSSDGKAGYRAAVALRSAIDGLLARLPGVFAGVENQRVVGLCRRIQDCLREHVVELDGLVLAEYGGFPGQSKSSTCGANAKGGGGFQAGNDCAAGGDGSGGGDEPAKKPKLTPAQRAAKSLQDFEDNMKTKTPADEAAFRKARAEKAFIPPAWVDVEYFGKGEDIIAMGRDGKGRKQRMENPAYRQGLSDKNNARIDKELLPRMASVRKQLRADAIAGNEEAKVLYVITQTGFRIGGKGDGKAEKEAFGASSLLAEHVSVKGNTVSFDFPGKKGVQQQHSITDPVIAKMMAKVGDSGPVFSTRAESVREAWQGRYGGAKVHDIRHVVATEVATAEIKKLIPPPPASKKERDAIVRGVSEAVGKKLGNDRDQARKTYISPSVWGPVKVKQ